MDEREYAKISHRPEAHPALVEMRAISRRFGGVRALCEVDFDVREGEVHCLAGENGCGKSTLIKILSGVLAPDSGKIGLAGKFHPRLSPAASQAAGVQIIYQDLSLFPNLSVAENIAFHRHQANPIRWVNGGALRREAKVAMARLGVSLPLDEIVQELPIASRQLVAICRTLATEARVVVMDEPTASLTHQEADALLATIRVLKAQGVATVLVSHRLDDMMRIGDRVTVLRDGRNAGTFAMRDLTRLQLGELISGQKHLALVKPAFAREIAPVLEVRGLTRKDHYTDINLTVRPGEILGITGRLGSGRTELALSLFGMNRPDAGEIRLDGKVVTLSNNPPFARGLATSRKTAYRSVLSCRNRLRKTSSSPCSIDCAGASA